MTITRRLIITLGIAILALLVVGGAGLYEQEQSSQRFETAINGFTSGVHELNTATYALIDAQGALTLYSLSNSPTTRQAAKTSLDTSLQKLDQALAAYSGHVHDAQDSKLLNDEKSKIPDYRQGIAKFLKLASSGYDDEAARRLLTEGSLNNSATNLRQALEKHIDYNIKLSFDRIATNRTVYNATLVRTVILIAAVLVLMLYMAIKLFRSIRRGLKSIRDTLQTVDQSLDFTLRAKVDGQDEISQTGRAFNSLLERLQGNLRSILDGARQVAGASEDLTQVAARVAAAADSQNEASASMAATIGQMTVSVNHITSRAETSQVLAHNAGELAGQGSDTITTTIADIRHISGVVDKAANSIRELDSYSARVDTVVGVIRDIADQTNLLALNAAIEAARAGEMGRGFAVVADEVRKLAERTAASTGEISSTIQSMRDRSQMATQQMKEAETLVRDGVGRADRADQAIQQIGTATRETAGVVVEISRSIREQEVATSTIASQVEQVAGMTDQATSAARAAAASARQLDELAHRQIATLSSYRL